MVTPYSSIVDQILDHLCSKEQYGDVVEWCEMRNDCVIVVTCPDCSRSYALTDDEYDDLVRRSDSEARSCGIRLLAS